MGNHGLGSKVRGGGGGGGCCSTQRNRRRSEGDGRIEDGIANNDLGSVLARDTTKTIGQGGDINSDAGNARRSCLSGVHSLLLAVGGHKAHENLLCGKCLARLGIADPEADDNALVFVGVELCGQAVGIRNLLALGSKVRVLVLHGNFGINDGSSTRDLHCKRGGGLDNVLGARRLGRDVDRVCAAVGLERVEVQSVHARLAGNRAEPTVCGELCAVPINSLREDDSNARERAPKHIRGRNLDIGLAGGDGCLDGDDGNGNMELVLRKHSESTDSLVCIGCVVEILALEKVRRQLVGLGLVDDGCSLARCGKSVDATHKRGGGRKALAKGNRSLRLLALGENILGVLGNVAQHGRVGASGGHGGKSEGGAQSLRGLAYLGQLVDGRGGIKCGTDSFETQNTVRNIRVACGSECISKGRLRLRVESRTASEGGKSRCRVECIGSGACGCRLEVGASAVDVGDGAPYGFQTRSSVVRRCEVRIRPIHLLCATKQCRCACYIAGTEHIGDGRGGGEESQ
eukprot:Opistho-2@10013